VTACIHTPARCNGGGYDGCACGNTDPVHTDRQREAVSGEADLASRKSGLAGGLSTVNPASLEECPTCGLHPSDFTVDEYKRELDRVEGQRDALAAELERVTAALRRFAISEEVDGPCWCGCYPGLRLPHDSHSEDCVAARAALAGGARAEEEGEA
jgi:hypothetical protein